MSNPRRRMILLGGTVLCLIWVLAWGAFHLASNARVTAESVVELAQNLNLETLPGNQRDRALRDLADKLNHLDPDQRRKIRLGRKLEPLFQQMSEEEKGTFIEATMPAGLKQMLTSFEKLPEDRRRRAITNAVERLRRDRDSMLPTEDSAARPPVLSEELQRKAVTLGLRTFYSESSAQTKAELAPLLEELQRSMESGRFWRESR